MGEFDQKRSPSFAWPAPRAAVFSRLLHREGEWAVEFTVGGTLHAAVILNSDGWIFYLANKPFASTSWTPVCPLTSEGRRTVQSARFIMAQETDLV